MPKRKLLFVCTGNCCRSQMAEAIARHDAGHLVEVHSCGSMAAGYVHPLALATLEVMGIPTDGLESKSWDRYLDEPFDVVITVCDNAASGCPVFPGGGLRAHWPLPDPSHLDEPEEQCLAAAYRVAERLRLKIQRLAALDWSTSPANALAAEIDALADL